jgi:rare lipoprotein A (peptidoglycan hydrolase)
MRLRPSYGVPIVALVLISGALASHASADELPSPGRPAAAPNPPAITLEQLAAATEASAEVASTADIGSPVPAEVQTVETAPVALPVPAPPPQKPAVPQPAVRPAAKDKVASVAAGAPRAAGRSLPDNGDSDRKFVQVRAVGPCQYGNAAWYGGRYVGRRTSSGERLDLVHATAAHRDLPLNTLVRVTNLANGRSVIVRITDRGPVSEALLIDMSPKAADQLAMKAAGIVPVSIEQVAEVATTSK